MGVDYVYFFDGRRCTSVEGQLVKLPAWVNDRDTAKKEILKLKEG